MRKIEFKAGYYEWHLLVDDKLYYVVGDDFTDWVSDCEEYRQTGRISQNLVETYVNVTLEVIEQESEHPEDVEEDYAKTMQELGELTPEEKEEAKKQMVRVFTSVYADK